MTVWTTCLPSSLVTSLEVSIVPLISNPLAEGDPGAVGEGCPVDGALGPLVALVGRFVGEVGALGALEATNGLEGWTVAGSEVAPGEGVAHPTMTPMTNAKANDCRR